MERPPWDSTQLHHPALTHIPYLAFPARLFRVGLLNDTNAREYIYEMLYEYALIRGALDEVARAEQKAIIRWEAAQELLLPKVEYPDLLHGAAKAGEGA